MKINLEDYAFEHGKVVSNPTAEENGRSFILQNDSKYIVRKWAIDKVIFKNRDEERCDYLLLIENKQNNVYYWIELKGRDINKGCGQILSTICLINTEGNAVQHARVISTGTIAPALRNNNYKKLDNFMRVSGGKLQVYTNQGIERI